ncbi:MAG: DEAD/DEAH box helicase [Paludibacter sp. 47-17]|nr:MAG: DEAD/DEAH box helicase [Paludibacter sp. 47-17]
MTFSEFNLSTPLLNALADLGMTEPTTIQEKAYPVILSGRDMVGIAQTGTGKTMAFLLPALRQWKFSKDKNPVVVVVVPTRELAQQVADDIAKLTPYMPVRSAAVYGGVNMVQQTPLLLEGLDFIVGTPGRLLDFLLNGTLKFRNVKKFIIDEVDEMLNLGFRPQLVRLMEFLPARRQNLMFSATMTAEIRNFIADYFIDPQEVEAARSGAPLENIKQAAIKVPNFSTKINLLSFFVRTHPEFAKVLLFVSTRQMADDVFDALPEELARLTGVIHANKSQNFRFAQLRRFNEGDCRILIATDLVARGLDFDDVTHVVNFDLPQDPESYMHRIGRTGRIAKKGVAISFITPHDTEARRAVEELMGRKIALMAMPDEVEISDESTSYDQEEVKMKNVLVALPKRPEGGGAFHEKAAKNKKVNNKVRYKDKMMAKYGKPKTRGMKK